MTNTKRAAKKPAKGKIIGYVVAWRPNETTRWVLDPMPCVEAARMRADSWRLYSYEARVIPVRLP